MNTHPEAIRAQQRALERAQNHEIAKSFIDAAQKAGVHFLELSPYKAARKSPSKTGRMTLAYREHGRSVVEVATAICHPNDHFCKVTGRFVAGQNLISGARILMRRPSYYETTREWLIEQFRTYDLEAGR